MNVRTSASSKQITSPLGTALTRPATIALLLAGAMVGGCGKPPEEKLPPAEVKTVEAYGVTLDPAASPQQVVYVMLRSIADDYAHAKSKDTKAQREAQLITYSLCAPRTIEERLVQTLNLMNADAKKAGLGDERDQRIFKTVHLWGPVIGHYVPSFANADLQTVTRDSWATISANERLSYVYYPVSHDPAAEPANAQTATISVELVREAATASGPEYWRIASVRFLGLQVPPPTKPVAVLAHGLLLDESATPQQVAWVMLKSLAQLIQADKSQAKDLRVSAMYRVLCLSNIAQLRAKHATGEKTNDTDALAMTIKSWGMQVAPNLLTIQTSTATNKMQVVNNTDGTADVTCPLDGNGASITVQLARQAAIDKTYWRVVGVKASPATSHATLTTSSPATAPAN